ncbi:tetratricopeptide repeat protein [Phormidesmis sp. 146-12]
MFSFLKLSAIVMVLLFPLFFWIGIEQGNAPPEKMIPQPKTAQDFIHRGELYEKTGSYEKALADYTQAVALSPDEERGYIRQGLALEALDRSGEALRKYQKAKVIAQAQGNQNEIQHADFFIQNINKRR